jgi:hypothetical protein
MHIKIIEKYYHTPIRMAIIKKVPLKKKRLAGCEEKIPNILGGNVLVQPLWRKVCKFLKKLKIHLPYYPPNSLLGM